MVKGSKIDMSCKSNSRPSTAVVKRPKAVFPAKKKSSIEREEMFREVSGW